MGKKKHDDEAQVTLSEETAEMPADESGAPNPDGYDALAATPVPVATPAAEPHPQAVREQLVAQAKAYIAQADRVLAQLEKFHDRYERARVRLGEAAGAIR